MKTREFIILAALLAVIAWNLRGCFVKADKTEKMIRNEVELEHLKAELPTIIHERDSITAKYDSAVSVSNQRFNDLETRKQPIQYVIKNTPATINSYDKEQLRGAITTGN